MVESPDNILNLIANGENQRVEFKESFRKDVVETLSAFANTLGGSVFIGVKDDGSIKGIEVSEEILKEWINRIKQSTQPQLFPSIIEHLFEDRRIVEIRIPEYQLKPVACRGRYLKRMGASNHFLTSDEIVELRIQSTNSSYDSVLTDNSIKDLDFELIEKYFNTVKSRGRISVSDDTIINLQKLGFIKKDNVSLASLLLFGSHNNAIHIGRFKTPTHILDDMIIKTPLIAAVDEIMEFIKKNIRLGYEFNGELQRVEKWEYPLPAIRELLLNSIVHKDYRDPNDVVIKIFDDKIIFQNPGGFMGNLTAESVMKDDYSPIHRNKLLAEAFYLLGDIEKYGTGFLRIREYFKDYPGMSFQIEDLNGLMKVTVFKKVAEKMVVVGGINGGINGGIKDLLTFIKNNPGKRTNEIASSLNVPEKTVEKWIVKLRENKLIEFRGSKKTGGYWETKKSGDI